MVSDKLRSVASALNKSADIYDTFFGGSQNVVVRSAASVAKGGSTLFPKSQALKNVAGANRKWGMVHLLLSVTYSWSWITDANTQFELAVVGQIDRNDTGIRGNTDVAGESLPQQMISTQSGSLVHETRASYSETDPLAIPAVPNGSGLFQYFEFPRPIPMVRPYYLNQQVNLTKSNAGAVFVILSAYVQVESIRVPWKKYMELMNEYTAVGDQGTITPGRR